MKQLEDYKLKATPFRSVPASVKSPELIWAGFPAIKEKFESIITKSIRQNPSCIVLNWGEYGSGKTHASRYFNKTSVLNSLKGEYQSPLFIPIDFPQSKQPVWDILKSIIDKVDFENIRTSANGKIDINNIVEEVTDNRFVQAVIKAIFNTKIKIQDIKLFLYKGLSNTEIKKKLLDYGIERSISSDNDLVDIISALFSVVTFRKQLYSCVILWFDEFEDITTMTNINLISINSSLRQMFEKSQNNLLMILNITQSSFMNQDDLSEYISPAIESRINNSVEIQLPQPEDIKLYLRELLNDEAFRIETDDNKLFPFEEDVVDEILKKLSDPSIRKVNEILSLVLNKAMEEGVDKIDKAFFDSHKNNIL